MPRARNLKYQLFTNDELANKNDPLGRLLFIGLWTIADFRGNVEYRPARIKAMLLPYDVCDIDKLTINLDKSGFIQMYANDDKIYLNVINFDLHQNPHKNERSKGSLIPCYSEEGRQRIDFKGFTINLDKSGEKRNEHHTNPADPFILIPDSGFLKKQQCDAPKTADDSNSKKTKPKPDAKDLTFSEKMHERIIIDLPGLKKPNITAWADIIRKMRICDKRNYSEMKIVFQWSRENPHWKKVIINPKKLREHYDQVNMSRLAEDDIHGNKKTEHRKNITAQVLDIHNTSW